MNITKDKFKKVIAGSLAFGTVLLGVASPAHAANMTSASVLLSGSRPSATATTYTWKFNPGTAGTLRCVQTTYSTSATTFGAGTAPAGMSTGAPATIGTLVGLAGTYTLTNTNNYQQKITSASGDAVTTATAIEIPINAMVNPSAEATLFAKMETFTDEACTTAMDSIVVTFRIQNGVTVSATVDPTLTFLVAGLAPAATYKTGEAAVSAGCTDSATAVSFPSSMLPDTDYACAQSLTTSTNATSGYTVTLRGTHTATKFLKATVNEITDSTGTNATPAAWPSAAGTEAFGYTTNDALLGTGTVARFSAADTWAQVPIATTPVEVAYFNGPVSADAVNIGYKFRFAGTTKAGSYSGTVVYVATPVF